MMLKAVSISNFRGIKSCKIENLSLINIFIGKNNACKSTILDAIYWGLKQLHATRLELDTILRRRIRRPIDRSEIFFSYNEDEIIKLSLFFDNNEAYEFKISKPTKMEIITADTRIRTRLSRPDDPILTFIKDNQELYLCSLRPDLSTYSPATGFYHPVQGSVHPDVLKYAESSNFLSSHITLDELWVELDRKLGELKQQPKLETDFIERMKDIYGIKYYEYVPLRYKPENRYVAFAEGKFRIYGAFHGGGVQRCALILSNLELASNTALFIEEPETYQYPEAIRKMVKHMVELARNNKVQLFITTHSFHDFLRFIRYEDEELRIYNVTRDAEGNVSANMVVDENTIWQILKELYG